MAGQNPAMVVKIAADISAMRAALREGTSVITTTTAAMGKLAASFDGSKIIQHAHNVTAAVNQIGGASRLTAAEQARVNTVVEKAIEKYRVLGQQAPADMQRLADATKKVETQTTLSDKATGLFAGTFAKLVAAFSVANLIDRVVSSLVSFAKEAFRSAGAIVDLAAKTGLSMDTIQRMSFVAKQTGTDVDAFTTSAFKLGVQLSGGSKSVVASVNELGLSYAKLKTQSPDQQFAAVIKALEGMADPQERNRLGVLLFGKTFQDMASAVSDGYTKLADGATVVGDAQVLALERAGDAYDKFLADSQSKVTTWIGNVVLNFQGFAKAMKAALAGQVDLAGNFNIELPLEQWKKGWSPDVIVSYVAEMKAAKAEIAALTVAQRAEIAAGQALGVTMDILEKKYKLTEGTLKVFTTAIAASTQGMKTAESAQIAWEKSLEAGRAELARIAKAYTNTLTAWDVNTDKLNKDSADKLAAMTANVADVIIARYTFAVTFMQKFGLNYLQETDKLNAEAQATLEARTENVTASILLNFEAARTAAAKFFDGLTGLFDAIANLTGSEFIGWLGDVANSLATAERANLQLKESLTAAGDSALAQGAAWAQWGSQVVTALDQATQSASKWKSAAGGALAGAQAGSQFGPWGTAIGAIAGLFVGLIKSQDKLAAARRAAMDSIVKERAAFVELAGGIAALREKADLAGISLDKLFQFQTDAAEFKAEIDRINAAFAAWQARIAGLNQAAGGLGSMTTGFAAPFLEAGAELDKLKQSLPALKAAVKDALKPPGVVMNAKEALALDNAIGELQKVEQKIRDIKWNLTDMRDKGQAAFTRLGTYALATFASILKETGSMSAAFAAVGPSLDTLIILQGKFGLTSSATVQTLLDIRKVVTANQPLMQQIDGLTQLMTGLAASGHVNQTLFTAFGQDATAQFVALEAKTKNADQALALMQPTLQQLWQMQQTYGFEVDATTQALIDEAVKIGLVGEKHKPVSEKMLTALLGIKGAIEALTLALTGPKGATDALADLGAKTRANQTEWTEWGNHGVAQSIRIQRGLDAIEFPDMSVPGPGGGGVPSTMSAQSSSSRSTQGGVPTSQSMSSTVGDVHVHFGSGPSSFAEAEEKGFIVADTVIKLLETNAGGRRTKARKALRVA